MSEPIRMIILQHEFNVIIIDWYDGSSSYNYVKAAKNVKVAAEKIYR